MKDNGQKKTERERRKDEGKNINWQKKIKKTKNAMKMYFIPFFDGYLRFHATINIIYQLPYSASGVKSLFVYIYIFSFFFFGHFFFQKI